MYSTFLLYCYIVTIYIIYTILLSSLYETLCVISIFSILMLVADGGWLTGSHALTLPRHPLSRLSHQYRYRFPDRL